MVKTSRDSYLAGHIDSLLLLSTLYKDNNPDTAIVISHNALGLSSCSRYYQGKAKAYEELSIIYESIGERKTAVDFLLKYIKQSEKLGWEIEVVNGYSKLAANCIVTNNLDIACKNLYKAVSIAKGNDNSLAMIYFNFSTLYQKKNAFDTALYYSFKALSIYKKHNNSELVARCYRQIGDIYLSLKLLQESKKHYENSIVIFHKIKNRQEEAISLTRIGHLSFILNQYDSCLVYNKKALEIRIEIGKKDLIASSLANIGGNYYYLNNFQLAETFLTNAITILDKKQSPGLAANIYQKFYLVSMAKKDYIKAIDHYNKYSFYHEKFLLELNKTEIASIVTNKFLQEKDDENRILRIQKELQESKIRTKNIIIVIILLTLILLSVFSLFILHTLRRIQREKKVQAEMINKLNAEIIHKKFLEYDSRSRELDYRFLNDHNPDLIIRENYSFIKKYVSPASLPILGYTPEEMMEITDFPIYIHEDSKEQWLRDIERTKHSNRTVAIVFKAKRKDNTTIWAECLVNPIKNEEEPVEMISVMRDISERYELTEEMKENAKNKDLLMREVNHRVKNNMGILLSLVRMHQFKFDDEKIQEMLKDLQYRVKTMALVHDQLNKNKSINDLSTGIYFSDLVKGIVNALKKDEIEINTYFYEEMIHVGIIQPLGLIINETMTNSFKYAFPDNRKGNIWIKYEKVQGDAENIRKLSIVDDGVGFIKGYDFAEGERIGSELVVGLSNQLNGEITIDGSNGVSFTITLPVSGGKPSETT